MSASGKPTAREELERIEDALADSILESTGDELRKEIAETGGNPDELIAGVDSAFASARAACARQRLEAARSELGTWRGGTKAMSPLEREAAQARLERVRSGDAGAGMMMAARKGEGLSESDLEGLIEDMAELERLERGDDER